jgi:hypothetical protein
MDKYRSKARWTVLLLVILATASCSTPELSYFSSWKYTFNDGGQQFSSLQTLCTWIRQDIRYDSDVNLWGFSEYWASPEQTLEKKAGDCDDDAILFMYFAHTRNLADDPELLGVQITPSVGHALVKVDDEYYDPTNGVWGPFSDITSRILFIMPYTEALFVATHGHDASKALAGQIGRIPLDTQWYNLDQTSSKESRDGVTVTSSADLKVCGSSLKKVDTLRGSTAGR